MMLTSVLNKNLIRRLPWDQTSRKNVLQVSCLVLICTYDFFVALKRTSPSQRMPIGVGQRSESRRRDFWSMSEMSNDKMSNDKMSNDKMSNDKMSNDKMSNDKMSNDKMSNDKMSNDKMSNDKMSKLKL
jgi:pentapeptide MXKDX repeat protein